MVDLTPDCANCAALCCVALAFDAGDMFAFDKAAGVPCKHLEGTRCGIHAGLENAGLQGCVHYQCEGAGQRVVQEVFDGASWQENPALLRPMLEAFSQMRAVHRHLVLLEAAEALPLSAAQRDAIAIFRDSLSPENGFTAEALAALESSGIFQSLPPFFKSLRSIARPSGDAGKR